VTGLRLPVIELHKVKDLVPWDGNPRVHDAEQLRLLVESIRHYGLAALIVIQHGTRRILAGHGRHEALLELGEGETVIPCVAVECSLEDAESYTVADNRLTDLGEWNVPRLRDILGELDNGAWDPNWAGYTPEELAKLFGPVVDVPETGGGEAADDLEPIEYYELEVAGAAVRVTGPDKKKATRMARALATVLAAEVVE
jgi:ParB-like chromosome segregation protein Spo0J